MNKALTQQLNDTTIDAVSFTSCSDLNWYNHSYDRSGKQKGLVNEVFIPVLNYLTSKQIIKDKEYGKRQNQKHIETEYLFLGYL